ncbi:MAG: SDR family NAD(P)-dependent oxidoreductase [Alkalispirochaeta sp.]
MIRRYPVLSLNGAHAVVTGGARGIGFATTRRLLAAGAVVSLWDRDIDALDGAEKLLGKDGFDPGSIGTVAVDITDSSAVSDALERSVAVHGVVDILVNNAGYFAPGAFIDQPPEIWMRTLEINVNALVYLTRLVVPGMYERRRGHIVNISSAAGVIGVPRLAVYSAAKWAVWGFSEALRGEALEHNVMVTSVHPSYVATGMFGGARLTGLGALLVPQLASHDVVAEAIVEQGLRKGKGRVMRPRSVRLAVLFRGVLPDRWFNGLMRLLGVWNSMSTWHGRGDGTDVTPRGGEQSRGGGRSRW